MVRTPRGPGRHDQRRPFLNRSRSSEIFDNDVLAVGSDPLGKATPVALRVELSVAHSMRAAEIPPPITTPDKVESSLGTLQDKDGAQWSPLYCAGRRQINCICHARNRIDTLCLRLPESRWR